MKIAPASLLQAALPPAAQAFLAQAAGALADGPAEGTPPGRLARHIALASRAVRSGTPLAPGDDIVAQARAAGFDPTHWSTLEALRVALLLHVPRREGERFEQEFVHCLRYADHGETCALLRALPLLPKGERFVSHAAEGCRSNMRTVFEAAACDSPYPARHFDDVAWCQLVVKAVFIDVPLARVVGLDERLSPDLARMALDLADERRSAGRPVPPQLWLCLGPHGGERGRRSLARELDSADPAARAAALFALGRANDSAWPGAPPWPAGQDFRHTAFVPFTTHHRTAR